MDRFSGGRSMPACNGLIYLSVIHPEEALPYSTPENMVENASATYNPNILDPFKSFSSAHNWSY
jgi:hypothetical protein